MNQTSMIEQVMINSQMMTKVDHIVDASKELTDDEKRQAAARILQLVPRYNAELEASLARGIAEMRAGLGTDAEEFLAELEAEDLAEAQAAS